MRLPLCSLVMKPCMAMEQVDCYHYLAVGELTIPGQTTYNTGNPLGLVDSSIFRITIQHIARTHTIAYHNSKGVPY